MARNWSDEDLTRVARRLAYSIAKPLEQPAGWQKVDKRLRKYRNEPTRVDGHRFASKLEAKRYGELKLLVAGGMITDLRLQTRWDLRVNGFHVGYYLSDFDYLDDGFRRLEDCKGVVTPVYQLKKRMLKAQYGYDILEIKA